MTIEYRRGTPDDTRALYDIFVAAAKDLEIREGTPPDRLFWNSPEAIERYWQRRGSLFQHIAHTAVEQWVALRDANPIGYARAVENDGVRDLTEFFVLPQEQSAGVGRGLLARTFATAGRTRAVLASSDVRALARYLKAGVTPHFPVYYLHRAPEAVAVETDLVTEQLDGSPATLDKLAAIDREILGFARPADHGYLLGDRQGTLYWRGGRVVGYAYHGKGTGPIALLEASDFPAVLARLEGDAAQRGEGEFGMQLPLVNRAALDHLLARGFRLEDFTTFFMTDAPLGRFENYVLTSPPFIL
jgi:GNAT superfamily N-acetyltransferase